jgi:hypothetical protein
MPRPRSPSFQQRGQEQGAAFEEICEAALTQAGFNLCGRHIYLAAAGVNSDFVVANQQGLLFYVTAKGSWSGSRPGLKRTDTFRKAIAEAALLTWRGYGRVLLLSSHLPGAGSGMAMLRATPRSVLFDVLHPTRDAARLRWLATADTTSISEDLEEWPNLADLVLLDHVQALPLFLQASLVPS